MTIPQALELALQHHRAGRLADAEALYRQILAAQPNHPEALRLLGLVASQVGRHDLAVEWICKSIVFNSNNPVAHSNLGEAYRVAGRLDEAIAAHRRALQVKPDFAEGQYNLGIALGQGGQLDEAVACYRRALQIKPDFPAAHMNLGNALRERVQLDDAIAAYRQALQFKPDYPEAHTNLGTALADRGQFDEAIAAHRRALAFKPDYPEAHNNLGNALRDRGHLDDAIAAYRRALHLKPDFPAAHNNLGIALRERGQLDESIVSCRRALELNPGYPEAHNSLGIALSVLGQLDESIASYRRALELKPDYPEAHNNLGGALKDRGELDEAIAAYRRALQFKPDYASAHSNLIFTLHFHPSHDATTLSQERQRWNRQFSAPLKPFLQPHANDLSLDRRLRVGYVSPDFRDHVIGRFVLPLFERHDRERFEILCYSGVACPDRLTERFRALAGKWRSTAGVSDARLAEMIREDAVDILVDLTMHTAHNRLTTFALQPAPVQVTWLAYPGSTGLHSIGYRLTDAHMDPPGEKPPWSSEEPVRLPGCWCCYQPPAESPDINALPALSAKAVTLGSLNNFTKVNETVLALWARVLLAVEQSRLIMLCPEGQTRERVRAFFSARGIAAARVEFASFQQRGDYLGHYQRIDLGLDPFPVNGMTTTCDTLWMGVPVLTLSGEMPISRAGLSLLACVGLQEFAAASEEDYVRIAVELAGDLPRLAELRATLRPRMQASPLMDAPRFARNVEAAYRSMWERRRAKPLPGSGPI